MENSIVKQKSRVLWVIHLLFAITPLISFWLLLEMEKFSKVRLLLMKLLSPYVTIFEFVFLSTLIYLVYQGWRLYSGMFDLVKNGSKLTPDEILISSRSLKIKLKSIIGTANIGLAVVTLMYVAGTKYYYTFLQAAPYLLVYFLCLKIYYLQLIEN